MKKRAYLFLGIWLFILLTECFDIYCLIHYQAIVERNPIGRWLINVDGNTALFAATKCFVIVCVLTVLPVIYQERRSTAISLLTVLAIARAWLLWQLLQ